MIGRKYGRLTVVSLSYKKNGNYWHCACDCGGSSVKNTSQLNCGGSMSCGCGAKENLAKLIHNNKTNHPGRIHGMARSRLDNTLDNMIKRCENPKDKRWDRYGGRGISICHEWRTNRKSFYDWALANGYDPSLTIDRINVDGNYQPSNCRWVTASEQQNNTSRNRYLEWNGRRETVANWARELGVRNMALQHRVDRGWSVERIFTQPFRSWPKK